MRTLTSNCCSILPGASLLTSHVTRVVRDDPCTRSCVAYALISLSAATAPPFAIAVACARARAREMKSVRGAERMMTLGSAAVQVTAATSVGESAVSTTSQFTFNNNEGGLCSAKVPTPSTSTSGDRVTTTSEPSCCVGAELGALVGANVGVAVVGADVGANVGAALGDELGAVDGADDGAAVG